MVLAAIGETVSSSDILLAQNPIIHSLYRWNASTRAAMDPTSALVAHLTEVFLSLAIL